MESRKNNLRVQIGVYTQMHHASCTMHYSLFFCIFSHSSKPCTRHSVPSPSQRRPRSGHDSHLSKGAPAVTHGRCRVAVDLGCDAERSFHGHRTQRADIIFQLITPARVPCKPAGQTHLCSSPVGFNCAALTLHPQNAFAAHGRSVVSLCGPSTMGNLRAGFPMRLERICRRGVAAFVF